MGSSLSSIYSSLEQNFPPKPQWTANDIPDLSGKVMIVTGGNTGIGKATVKALLEHNAKVYLAARSQEKAEVTIQDLKNEIGKEAIFLKLDLADLESIKATVEEFTSKETQLHVLFNNGGVMTPPIEQLTTQGYDLQFGTNALGHFYLTKLLLPVLLQTAANSPDKKARVVTTSSMALFAFPKIDFNTLKDSPARKTLGKRMLYGQSSFARTLFSLELARRYGEQGIVSTTLHPGPINTDLVRHLPRFLAVLVPYLLRSPAYGALTQLRAGTDPEGIAWNGKYLKPWGRLGEAHKNAYDTVIAKELWEYMDEQVKKY